MKIKIIAIVILLMMPFIPINSIETQQTRRGINVEIKNFAFSPSTISIGLGENVTFHVTNSDSVTHTFSSGGEFDTGSLSPSATKDIDWTAPSTSMIISLDINVGFVCNIHSSMSGNIVVGVVETNSSTTTSNESLTSETTQLSTTSSESISSDIPTSQSSEAIINLNFFILSFLGLLSLKVVNSKSKIVN